MRGRLRGLTAACAGVLLTTAAQAFFVDQERRFDFRMRVYHQASILTESSERDKCDPRTDPTASGCVPPPKYSAGDLAQLRTFYNPEFEAKLKDFSTWMDDVPGVSYVSPEDLRFRFAWWGFYDAVYDEEFAGSPWRQNARNLKGRFAQSDNPQRESFFFNDENKRVRNIYGKRNRINEMYLDYTKGRVFVRAGRQAISWGESDTIAIIDNQNPFDLTLGAPGFFQDLDEARIPLWTLRSTVKLFDTLGPLSSLFLDAYIVPGIIDTTVPINPITGGVSAFGPDVADPFLLVPDQEVPLPGGGTARVHPNTVDRLPSSTWGNSRWGVRLTSVVNRDYTVQTFFYRTFNQQPAPVLVTPGGAERAVNQALNPDGPGANGYRGAVVDDRGFRVNCNNGRTVGGNRPCGRAVAAVTVLERKIYSVAALGASWYAQPLRGVVRTQFNYYLDEPAFIPSRNLNPESQLPRSVFPDRPTTSLPRADYFRFVLGYDTFFFFRPLNPSNSFVFVSAFTGSYNLSETSKTDFRNPTAKPGHPQTRSRASGNALFPTLPFIEDSDYEDAYTFEGFFQTALQTDYMHGKLSPRIVMIADVSGIFAFATGINYRFTDNLIGTVNYLAIAAGRKASIGTFRAHDMVQFKLTAQIN
jgi:hypothetical protein